jgi:DNA-binding protein H-NS
MPRPDDVDLDALTIPELEALAARIQQAIARRREGARRALRERLEKIAAEEGYSLPELVAAAPRKTRTKAKPKYANPRDASQTWAGRGKQPAWVREALAAGKTLADLAV